MLGMFVVMMNYIVMCDYIKYGLVVEIGVCELI